MVPESVQNVGRYAFAAVEALTSALRSASAEVGSVAGGSWTGAAADEFATGWTEVYDGAMVIVSALEELATKLGVTAESYRQRDESNAGALAAIHSLDLP
ncbi:WXG100 family type VII secretion target [Nocardia bovistercoris]|uniref:WXG100 family type VII secretion target n=1 Tax=Nocardia bovistercoris TaxID=2785916 RepID=UPI002FCCECD3